jgi:hypothetical protein
VMGSRFRDGEELNRAEGRLNGHGFSGLRLRTTRERDATRSLPQCAATAPLRTSRGTASYCMARPAGQSLALVTVVRHRAEKTTRPFEELFLLS